MSDTKKNSPTHYAYSVREYTAGGEKKAQWTKLGPLFPHADGQGWNLSLIAAPIDGQLVIRSVKDKKPADDADDEQG